MSKLTDIISLSRKDAECLARAGVQTQNQLLRLGSTTTGRMRLADQTGLDDQIIKRWVHQADLLRVPGMTPERAERLHSEGVLTVPKLAYRTTSFVYGLLASETRVTIDDVASMVAEAKRLPKIVEH